MYVRWENLCWQLTFGGALRPSGSKVFLFQWPSKLSLGGLSCSSRACTDAAPHDDLECSGAKQKKINIYIYTYIYIHIYIFMYITLTYMSIYIHDCDCDCDGPSTLDALARGTLATGSAFGRMP